MKKEVDTIFLVLYIKMSDTNFYQRKRETILNRAK